MKRKILLFIVAAATLWLPAIAQTTVGMCIDQQIECNANCFAGCTAPGVPSPGCLTGCNLQCKRSYNTCIKNTGCNPFCPE